MPQRLKARRAVNHGSPRLSRTTLLRLLSISYIPTSHLVHLLRNGMPSGPLHVLRIFRVVPKIHLPSRKDRDLRYTCPQGRLHGMSMIVHAVLSCPSAALSCSASSLTRELWCVSTSCIIFSSSWHSSNLHMTLDTRN